MHFNKIFKNLVANKLSTAKTQMDKLILSLLIQFNSKNQNNKLILINNLNNFLFDVTT